MSKIKLKDMIDIDLSPQQVLFVIEYTKDTNPRRAAVASGYEADYGYTLRKNPLVTEAVNRILQSRLDDYAIDAEWVLWEAVDNHMLARQEGNITASNTALKLVGQLASVDAFAAAKVELSSTKDLIKTLQSARQRLQLPCDDDGDDEATESDVTFF